MIKNLIWFAGGYMAARYLILKYGVEKYKEYENSIIGTKD